MHKYTQEEEERIIAIAKEINPAIPKIFSKQREILTLDYLLRLITACEGVLEEHSHHLTRVKKHSYRSEGEMKTIYAISFLIGEAAIAASKANHCFKIVHPEITKYHIYTGFADNELKYIKQEIKECIKKRKINISEPLAVMQNSKNSHYICTCNEKENIILFSNKKKLVLNEYEFYVSDADKSKKTLENYFNKS